MDFNRLTEKVQEALRSAQTLAVRLSHQQVDVEHLLSALLDQEGGLAPSILKKAGVNVEPLAQRITKELDRLPKVSNPSGGVDQFYVTTRLTRIAVEAEDEAKRMKDDYVSVEHFLLAMTGDTGFAGRALKEAGATRDRIGQALKDVRGSQRVSTQNPETTYEADEAKGCSNRPSTCECYLEDGWLASFFRHSNSLSAEEARNNSTLLADLCLTAGSVAFRISASAEIPAT